MWVNTTLALSVGLGLGLVLVLAWKADNTHYFVVVVNLGRSGCKLQMAPTGCLQHVR